MILFNEKGANHFAHQSVYKSNARTCYYLVSKIKQLLCCSSFPRPSMSTVLFSKLITRADLEKSLLIPTSLSLQPFEDGVHWEMDMNVHDDCGQEWIFPCSIQRNEELGHVLSIGWLEFAKYGDIRVGDKVIFLEEPSLNDQANGDRIKIKVERKIRLFGKDIWAALM
ncbi:hypothetical protein MANES_07G022000v8 [Manihot esculenta]|uniref:Uncharacterized protein n=1 Tax=Manihot esculenta TaxID=3983 RepID=A0ACB7HE55_MANES|nr:hypothetical protein MANES_07G022000v8 [Manihot esculenta]